MTKLSSSNSHELLTRETIHTSITIWRDGKSYHVRMSEHAQRESTSNDLNRRQSISQWTHYFNTRLKLSSVSSVKKFHPLSRYFLSQVILIVVKANYSFFLLTTAPSIASPLQVKSTIFCSNNIDNGSPFASGLNFVMLSLGFFFPLICKILML